MCAGPPRAGLLLAAACAAAILAGCAVPPAGTSSQTSSPPAGEPQGQAGQRLPPRPAQRAAQPAPVPPPVARKPAEPASGTDDPPAEPPESPPSPESSGLAGAELERGHASWYGLRFHGRRTASGEPFNMNALTAAHRTLPFGSLVRVKSLVNGREVVVRINDRGPHVAGRIIDLSHAAAQALDLVALGLKEVVLLAVEPGEPGEGLAAGGSAETAGEGAEFRPKPPGRSAKKPSRSSKPPKSPRTRQRAPGKP